MAEYDLLEKNELRLTDVTLDKANLNDIAAAVAEVMQLRRDEVLVTDYLDHTLTLDVLRRTVYPHQVIAKKDALLARLAAVPGVRLGPDTQVTSNGMLGWIAADEAQIQPALEMAERMAAELRRRVASRVMVFSTGGEVLSGEIEDTNRTLIEERLSAAGYRPSFGPTLRDDIDLIAGRLRRAADDGYGLIVTTGGVGAERKDCTVEAVLKLDPAAHTPYIARFERGHGRHVKDGVRIAIGQIDDTTIICLPGPNDEVRLCLPILVEHLHSGLDKARLAEAIAHVLRDKLRAQVGAHGAGA